MCTKQAKNLPLETKNTQKNENGRLGFINCPYAAK